MEYFDLYNRKGEKINKTMARGSHNLTGEYHRVVHIWIINSKGEYLIQQRNKASDRIPYQWAPTAGAVIAGEHPIQAAIREVNEEIGLSLVESELEMIDSIYVDRLDTNFIIDLFLVKKDVDLDSLVIQKTEVKDVKLARKKDIIKLVELKQFFDFNQFTNNSDYFKILEKR